LRRRQFIQFTVAGLGVAAGVLPFPAPDPYGDAFFARVRLKVIDIVREHGRGLRSLEIAAPEMSGGVLSRRVVVDLEIGSSLLDVNRVSWWEPVRA